MSTHSHLDLFDQIAAARDLIPKGEVFQSIKADNNLRVTGNQIRLGIEGVSLTTQSITSELVMVERCYTLVRDEHGPALIFNSQSATPTRPVRP